MSTISTRPLFDNAADAKLFIARDEAARLEANCRDGVNSLVLGDRGIGKTSLLRYVALRLREENFPCIVVDAAPAETALDVVRLVTAELGRRPHPIQQIARSFDPHLATGLGEPGELLNALRNLRQTDVQEGTRTAILLDSPPRPEELHLLFGRLRDEIWQLPYTWAVAAPSNQRGTLLAVPADAFFEDVIEMLPLTREQQAELVSRRLGPGEATPWRLQEEGEENPRRLLEAVRDAIRSGKPPESYFAGLTERDRKVNGLGRAAAMAYAELDNSGAASASDEELLKRLGWSRQRAAQVLADLERANLVRADMRPGPSGRPRKVFEVVPVKTR